MLGYPDRVVEARVDPDGRPVEALVQRVTRATISLVKRSRIAHPRYGDLARPLDAYRLMASLTASRSSAWPVTTVVDVGTVPELLPAGPVQSDAGRGVRRLS